MRLAVISVGGLLGVGDKKIALPYEQFSVAPDGNTVYLTMTEEELKSKPAFDADADDDARTADRTVDRTTPGERTAARPAPEPTRRPLRVTTPRSARRTRRNGRGRARPPRTRALLPHATRTAVRRAR